MDLATQSMPTMYVIVRWSVMYTDRTNCICVCVCVCVRACDAVCGRIALLDSMAVCTVKSVCAVGCAFEVSISN